MSNNVISTAAFALALLKKEVAAKPGKNVLVSPLSVSVALGMTANGARGKTLEGITTALSIDSDLRINNQGYAALLEKLKRAGISITLDVANAIFARLGVPFETAFLKANQEFFNIKVEDLDFDDPSTVDAINGFVSTSTNKKISRILEDPISSDTMMFLVNCVYFKGLWSVKFDKRLTKDLPFAGVGEIPTMYRNGTMIYGKDKDGDLYQTCSLPFGDTKEARMLVIVPEEDRTLDDVFLKLDAETLTRHFGATYTKKGELWLPRIEIEYENSLNASLIALGMEEAFGKADFGGMMPPPAKLLIKDVKHKTFLKVDEEGAEGGAATSVRVALESFSRPFSMKVDKPFVTFVVDSDTNAVIFAGVIVNPTQ